MLKDVCKTFYFDGNYNCAETLLRASNEYYELGLHDYDMKLVGSYGGGLQCGNTCGAVLGAAAVLSMKYVETKAHESAEIGPVTKLLMRKIKERYGSTLCKDIKAQSFDKEVRCYNTVAILADILEDTIAEYEASKAQ